ncbi:MAG: oligosaccharide flippase family protein, partial [bacterium]
MIINNGLLFLLGTPFVISLVYQILPQFQWRPIFYTNFKTFIKLFRFGIKIQISKIAQVISFQAIDKLLIARLLNIELVAFYELGSKIVNVVRNNLLILISPFIPAASEIDVHKDNNLLWKFYLRGSKYLILISCPIVIFIIINAQWIMIMWMGEGYGKSAVIIQILLIGYFANLITGVASASALGMGKPEFEMKSGSLH